MSATMEMNKDEALNCLNRARKAAHSGDIEQAKKFANKSNKLFPTEAAQLLIAQLSKETRSTESTTHKRKHSQDSSSSTSSSASSSSSAPTSSPSHSASTASTAHTYTPEQLEEVKRIKKCKTHYEVLGVEKNADDDTLRKSFRKWALKLHPDKNHAPGADEAFKRINKAYKVLSDAQAKAAYDAGYDDDENGSSGATQFQDPFASVFRRRRTGGDPGMFFNFGNDFDSGTKIYFDGQGFRFVRQPRQHESHRERENTAHTTHAAAEDPLGELIRMFIQLVPFLLLFILAFSASSYTGNENSSIYSFTKNSVYNIENRTPRGVVYYTRTRYGRNDKSEWAKLEKQIDEQYEKLLFANCKKDEISRNRELDKARILGKLEALEQLLNKPIASCKLYNDLFGNKDSDSF